MIPIDTLPDEVLLAIFDFFVYKDAIITKEVEAWQSLVHVCRRWRSIVFGSPRRLNLRLVCGGLKMPARDTLDVWPPLPLVIQHGIYQTDKDRDSLITILKCRDRVCQICLYDMNLPWEQVMATMKEPFPELTSLLLGSVCTRATVLSDSFLGGSASRLRIFHLDGISFPGLPKLLLSATHLVEIRLYNIPYSDHISPDDLVPALSTLTSLKLLILRFQTSLNQAKQHPQPTRSLLPLLNTLKFRGPSGYLEDLVARIDAPRLANLEMIFLNQRLDTPQITQFISRTPMLEALDKACVSFELVGAAVKLSSRTSGLGELRVKIPGLGLNRQVSFLKRFCASYLPLSASEDLYIYWYEADRRSRSTNNNVENIWWLELLRPFPAVKNLYLSKYIAPHVGSALHELVGGSTTDVLPIVQNIFLQGIQPRGPILEGIEEFIAARQHSCQPITVSTIPLWERDWYWASDFR